MKARLMAAGVWMLVAASVLLWGWRWQREHFAEPSSVPVVPVIDTSPAGLAALPRLLGSEGRAVAPEVMAAADARFALQGVVAGNQGRTGVALIAVDGKPARPYAVGAQVDNAWVVESLGPRTATLAALQGGTVLRIDMPQMAGVAATPVVPALGVAPAGPASAPVPAARLRSVAPSIRKATPAETTAAPGRRLRLHATRAPAGSDPQ